MTRLRFALSQLREYKIKHSSQDPDITVPRCQIQFLVKVLMLNQFLITFFTVSLHSTMLKDMPS